MLVIFEKTVLTAGMTGGRKKTCDNRCQGSA